MFGHIFLILNRNTGPLDSNLFHFIADANHTLGASFVGGGLTGQFEGKYLTERFFIRKLKNTPIGC